MRDVAAQLKAQNDGESWRDCEGAGLRHRFTVYPQQVVGDARYFTCTRPSCRVTVRRTQ